jgi:hypothetical protein
VIALLQPQKKLKISKSKVSKKLYQFRNQKYLSVVVLRAAEVVVHLHPRTRVFPPKPPRAAATSDCQRNTSR